MGGGGVAGPLLLLLIACGGDDAGSDSAMPVDAEPDAGEVFATLPALPDFGTCPDGWRSITDSDGVTTCDPYPESGVADCGPGQAHFLGTPGCAPVGTPCPSGDFADGLPASGNVIYVQAGATGGDGTRALPFGTLAEADVESAGAGDIIALAKGTYIGGVRLFSGVTLWGACAAETRLTASPSEGGGVLDIVGSDVVLRDLAVADSDRIGVWVVREGGGATFEGVSIENTAWQGLLANGGEIVADGLLIRGTRSRPRDGLSGRGLACDTGAQCTIRRVVVEDNREYGIRIADPGSRLVGFDITVRRTSGQESDGVFGRGLAIEYDSSIEVERAYLYENRDAGLLILESDASMRDIVIRGTLPEQSDSSDGRGVSIVHGTATIDRMVIEDNRDIGFFADGDTSNVEVRDLVIRRTRFDASDGGSGDGFVVQKGATATFLRAMTSNNQAIGMHLPDGPTVVATDLTIVDTLGSELDGQFGRGVNLETGATVTLLRARIADSREVGILVQVNALVTGTDVMIERTRASRCSDDGTCAHGYGSNAIIAGASSMSLQRFVSAESVLCGLHVATESSLDLSDGLVEGNEIGVCVQVDGYDLDRLQNDVVFRDNTSSLDATRLPVPDVTVPSVEP